MPQSFYWFLMNFFCPYFRHSLSYMNLTQGCNTRLPILKNLCIKIIFGLLKFVVLIFKDTKHIFIHLGAKGQSQNQLWITAFMKNRRLIYMPRNRWQFKLNVATSIWNCWPWITNMKKTLGMPLTELTSCVHNWH